MVLRRLRPRVVLEGKEHKEMREEERHAMEKPRGTVRGRGEEGAHRKQLVRRRSPSDGEEKWRRPGGSGGVGFGVRGRVGAVVFIGARMA